MSIFIQPPFQKCPRCEKDGSFGVLDIGATRLRRRCKECRHTDNFPLPALQKKILYLDQFAISNMMKALDPTAHHHESVKEDPFWLELFHQANRLIKLQLLVCPDSSFHLEESLSSPFPDSLRRMYKFISGDVSFQDHYYIEAHQIYQHVQYWASGQGENVFKPDVQKIVRGNLNGWQPRLRIWANIEWPENEIDFFRQARKKVNQNMAERFERWKKDKMPFNKRFKEEMQAYGRTIYRLYSGHKQSLQSITQAMVSGVSPPQMHVPFNQQAHSVVDTIHNGLRLSGVVEAEISDHTKAYLLSDQIENVPFVRITAKFYATLARQATEGMVKPPNNGFLTDVRMIATLLPYCDAMLVDGQCGEMLRKRELLEEVKHYGCRIFTPKKKTRGEILSYLKGLESNVSMKHLEMVKEVYGDQWLKPSDFLYRQ